MLAGGDSGHLVVVGDADALHDLPLVFGATCKLHWNKSKFSQPVLYISYMEIQTTEGSLDVYLF